MTPRREKVTAPLLGQPDRVAFLLFLLEQGKGSPVSFARRRVEQAGGEWQNAKRDKGGDLGRLAYHVRVLRDEGLVKPAGRRQVRGATEHLYEITDMGRITLYWYADEARKEADLIKQVLQNPAA